MLSDKKLKEFSNKFAKQMSVKMVNVDQFVSDLSGGNKQKVCLLYTSSWRMSSAICVFAKTHRDKVFNRKSGGLLV